MNFKNNELLMLGIAFILGVFVDRYMNHRDVVTGEVKEGLNDVDTVGAIVGGIIGILILLALSQFLFNELGWFYWFWYTIMGRTPSTDKAIRANT